MDSNRSYKFRLYPNKEIENKMLKTLEICRQTYNQLLSINQETYLMAGKGLTKYDMNKCINYGINADIKQVHTQTLQNTSDRIAKAYANFFRRLKEKKAGKNIKVGYPRYKKKYKSFSYPQSGFFLEGKKLKLSKIGTINIKIGKNQNRPNGIIKTLTIKREPTGKWFAIFSCIEQIEQKERVNDKKIGMDMGLEYFSTLSNGEIIENPRFYVENEKRLKHFQRKLSRKKLHSKNWDKANQRVNLVHEQTSNQRHNFHHQTTRYLVNNYGFISVEKLNIKSMVKHPYLAKHISDASWGTFTRILCYKAESAGGKVIEVNPRGTSQICSQCGHRVPKTLAQRWHRCPYCGVMMHRDHNSAKNILTEGTSGIACGERNSVLAVNQLEHSLSRNQEATQLVGW